MYQTCCNIRRSILIFSSLNIHFKMHYGSGMLCMVSRPVSFLLYFFQQLYLCGLFHLLLQYLLLAKGNVLFNVVSNSLLFMLRRFRDWFTYVLSHFPQKSPVPLSVSEPQSVNKSSRPMSAKERVVSKWGMD